MALALETVTSYTFNAAGNSRAVTLAAASDLLVVAVSQRYINLVTGITYAGAVLTQLGSPISNDNACAVVVFYKIHPATGENTLAVTLGGSRRCVVGVTSFSGSDELGPFGPLAARTADAETSSSLTVASAPGEIVLDFLATYQLEAGALSVGADQTERWNTETGTTTFDPEGAGSTEPGAASVEMSWSRSAAAWFAHGAIAVKPSGTADVKRPKAIRIRSDAVHRASRW